MDYNELWIGDTVYVKSLKKNAIWEGFAEEGKAKIKVGTHKSVVSLKDVSPKKNIKQKEEIEEIRENLKERDSPIPDELDLHMEKLSPDLIQSEPQLILIHQVSRCRTYIENAIRFRKYQIVIIHGKGTGALKGEILSLLHDFKEVWSSESVNDGGGLRVTFQYT